jgi:DNA-binding transcriptional regulator YiaG
MKPAQIKKLRKSLNMTLDEFAYQLGYRNPQRASNISRWENGRTKPSAAALALLNSMASKKQ